MTTMLEQLGLDGLAVECQHCADARWAAHEMSVKLSGWTLTGTTPSPDGDQRLDKPGVPTMGPWTIECYRCKSQGWVLTDRGCQLVRLIQLAGGLAPGQSVPPADIQEDEPFEVPY